MSVKRLFTALVAVAMVATMAAQVMPKKGTPTAGVVRVKLQPEVVATLGKGLSFTAKEAGRPLQTGVKPLDASLRQIKGYKIRKVFPCSPEREKYHKQFGLDQWYEISFDETITPQEAKVLMGKTAGVEKATMKVPMKMFDDGNYSEAPAPQQRATAAMPFNDPRLPQQWHYNNDGSLAGAVPGADINLFKAWQVTTGSPNVVVAIIDGGIDYNHEDLKANMWVNEKELNGKPGVDDDGNGYIDDVYGYNFCAHNGTIYPHPHGTHVAGTVGAVNNNGIGVCGVAGGDGTPNSGVKLMSCQTYDSRQSVDKGDFAAALIYAADMGATIAQCSWSWADPDYYESDVLDAVRYFTSAARSNNMTGGLCFFAAGNEAMTGQIYPSCMDEVVAVAAMACDLTPAPYSNYGSWVDVVAPGGYQDFNQAHGVLSTLPNDTYGFYDGTSMATPHVSGIAALILSKYGSSTLINETVRQQIITSVNDFYTKNNLAKGLFGSGYVDAYKALQWGDGTAPQPVKDLTVIAMQESAKLTWTIPSATSGSVNSHILYYSTEEFTESTLDKAKTVVIDTKFNQSGEKYTYQLAGLLPMTKYYFAIKAVDRWSNASKLSSVVSVTTNAGPDMTISRTSMAMNCTDGQTWSTRTFDINNLGEGLLKWSAKLATTASQIRAYGNEPTQLMTVPFGGQTTGQNAAKAQSSSVVKDLEDFTQDEYPQQICNFSSLYAFIGDKDCPNSMAQLFKVDEEKYPKGFNLTHIYIEGSYGKHPIFEVYRNAGTLGQSTLLQTYDPGPDVTTYYNDHALPECLHFAPGESFYIVVHFENFENRNYPLGLALRNDNPEAVQAYMSVNNGRTWTLLSESLYGSSYENIRESATWAITAKSLYPDWSEVLSLSPSEGQVLSGGKQTVTVTHNGTNIPNGNYRAKIKFETNESEPNDLSIAVTLNISGQQPNVAFNKVVEFGNLLLGQKKTVTVEVFNKGYGTFAGGETYPGIFSDKIKSTSEHFSGPPHLQSGIPARAKTLIDLTYEPKEAGSHSGVIILTDKDGRELRINVTGTATEPAKISISPSDNINIGDLNLTTGEEKTVNFTINNDGKYPLQYVMPKFSAETFDDIASSTTHRFGYVWQSNLYGSDAVLYEGMPELLDAVDITRQFADYDYFSDAIDIGFDFPFYGKNYKKIYVSSLGTLSFAPYSEGYIYSPLYESSTYLAGMGVISAYGFECKFSPTSKIEYAKHDGKFVVNFKDVLVAVYGTETMPASFHIALSPSGDIEMAYDDYTAAKVFQEGSPIWVGIVDPQQQDPMTVTSTEWIDGAYIYETPDEDKNRWRYINTGTAFKFYAPKPNLIAEIAPAAGIVAPGDKLEVTAKVKAQPEMYGGETYSDLVIMSNDLKTPTKLVRFNANIVGDLQPEFVLGTKAVDFKNVFRTSKAQQSVGIKNQGRTSMTLESISIDNGKFTHNFTAPLVIPAGQSKDIAVTLNTDEEGLYEGVMTISTTAGTKTVSLKGTVIGVPDISIGYNSVTETVASGENKAMPLTVKNTGNEPLTYSITAGNHVSYAPEYREGSNIHYSYVSSLDDANAKRNWIDIETTGLGEQYNFSNFINKDIVAVDLPFEFPFFGKHYKKMYIYDSGFVSFTSRNDEGIWPEPPLDFFQDSQYTNIIAPYWGLHTMDVTATAGIYYYLTDEMAVVSFIEYGNAMNIGIDFQLIMRKDGTFTFNYKAAYEFAVQFGTFGVAGIISEKREGIKLADRYIALESSVNFSPVVENTILPGAEDTANITILADELAGKYNGNITINTNIPKKPTIDIPVSLTITGEPSPLFPEDITVEQVAGYVNNNGNDELTTLGAYWYVPVEVKNSGSAPFTITGVTMECPKLNGESMFSLLWYGQYTDSWSGVQVNGWTMYDGAQISVGRNIARFALPFWSADKSEVAWNTPGEYNVKLTFRISGVAGLTTKTVNVKIVITDQPSMTLDKEEIRVYAPTDEFVSVESVNISNVNGKYPLKYTVTVDPTGVGYKDNNNSGGDNGGISPYLASVPENLEWLQQAEPLSKPKSGKDLQLQDVGRSDFIYDTPQQETLDLYGMTFNRALYWPGRVEDVTMYNYGSQTKYGTFKSATGFVGPDGGFNISHIYFSMYPYGLSYTDVEFEIVNGDPQTSSDVIGHGTFHLGEVKTELYQNALGICKLDRPVYISEGQEFYVVITYPVGQEVPASLIFKQGSFVSKRYLAYVDSYGWFDLGALFKDAYGNLGYVCTCLETVEGDAWVKMLNAEGEKVSELSGEIGVGESMNLNVRLSANEAPKEIGNKAVLIIKTNDPKHSVTNFPVILDKNSAPVIKVSSSNILINEGQKLSFNVNITDADGDEFTATVSDALNCATIASPSSGFDDGNWRLTLNPDYGTAGTYTATIKAVDVLGHASEAVLNFTVVPVNRAPVAKTANNVILQTGTLSEVINLNEIFSDPDDTELTYDIELSNTTYAKLFLADSELFFRGEKEGDVVVTVTATDPAGGTGTAKFNVYVRDDITAVENVSDNGISVTVNHSTQDLVITASPNDGKVRVAVFTPDGQKVATAVYDALQNETYAMSIASLAEGSYIVSVVTDENKVTKKITKQ